MSQQPWVEGMTFGAVLARSVERYRDRDAVVFPNLDLRWTYADFKAEVHRVARALWALGVRPGDHVGIWATNWPAWVSTQFATAYLGAVLVNVNPAYRTHELEYILGQADIHTLLITDRFKESDFEAMVAELVPALASTPFGEPLNVEALPRLRHVVSIKNYPSKQGIWSWDAFIEAGAAADGAAIAEAAATVTPDQPVNIQYTSGTTGSPKGAMLSHRNLLFNAYHIGQRLHATEHDRICVPLPFYHCFGCVIGNLLAIEHGAALIVPNEAFDPGHTLKAIHDERATAVYGVPTMFTAELHDPDFASYDLTCLRTGIMGGSPCPIELMRKVVDKMHMREVTIAYGLTECSPAITMTGTDEPLEIRCTTVGKPIDGVEVRLVDPATGNDVGAGVPGELWTRGHHVMIGYYNKPDVTAETIDKHGWLKTGDLAVRTPDGHYRITGRSKDVIIRGGENVYPREVEEHLLTHPKIQDVQVVGLPDETYGEQVSAWIVPNDPSLTENEVKAHCKGTLAHYKIPHYVVFVEEYPLTVTGKIQKYRLRDIGVDQFNLHAANAIETA